MKLEKIEEEPNEKTEDLEKTEKNHDTDFDFDSEMHNEMMIYINMLNEKLISFIKIIMIYIVYLLIMIFIIERVLIVCDFL